MEKCIEVCGSTTSYKSEKHELSVAWNAPSSPNTDYPAHSITPNLIHFPFLCKLVRKLVVGGDTNGTNVHFWTLRNRYWNTWISRSWVGCNWNFSHLGKQNLKYLKDLKKTQRLKIGSDTKSADRQREGQTCFTDYIFTERTLCVCVCVWQGHGDRRAHSSVLQEQLLWTFIDYELPAAQRETSRWRGS